MVMTLSQVQWSAVSLVHDDPASRNLLIAVLESCIFWCPLIVGEDPLVGSLKLRMRGLLASVQLLSL